MDGRPQKNLVLIMAREFASKLATATFLIDATGRLVYFNEAAEGILGRSFAELGELGESDWASLLPVEELDGTEMPMEARPAAIALRERRPAHHTFRFVALDGRKHAISATAFPLLASPQEVVGVVSIFWEIGEP
jgi:PAS domain S-box-containing protein